MSIDLSAYITFLQIQFNFLLCPFVIRHKGKLAGVVLRENSLRYVVATARRKKLQVTDFGSIDLPLQKSELPEPLLGTEIICGISRRRSLQKNVILPEFGLADDPDHLLWELSRSLTDNLATYNLGFLRLHKKKQNRQVIALGVKKERCIRIGRFFEENNLVLHSLIFEAAAIRQAARKFEKRQPTVFLVAEPGLIYMQLYYKDHLLFAGTTIISDWATASGQQKLLEEIGMHLVAAYGGTHLRRDLKVLLAGEHRYCDLQRQMRKNLPFDFAFEEITTAAFGVNSPEDFQKSFNQYFLPFLLAHLYNTFRSCELSQAKNAAWC